MKNIFTSQYKTISSFNNSIIIDIKLINQSTVEIYLQHNNDDIIQQNNLITVQSKYCYEWHRNNYWSRILMQSLIGTNISLSWKAYRTFPWPKLSRNRIYIYDGETKKLYKIFGIIDYINNNVDTENIYKCDYQLSSTTLMINEIVINLSHNDSLSGSGSGSGSGSKSESEYEFNT